MYRNECESQDTSYSVEAEFVSMDTLQTNDAATDTTENNTTEVNRTCHSVNFGNDRKRRRVNPDSTNLDSLLNYFKMRDERQQSSVKKYQENDIGSFSTHVRDILNKLPPVLQIKAKKDIFDVLFRYELMALQESRSSNKNSDD